MFIPHVKTPQNITVFFDGQPNIVATGTAQYDMVVKAIENGDMQGVRDAIDTRQAVVNMSAGKITLDGKTLMYDGRPLHGLLVDRILTVVKGAGDAGPMLHFLNNLMQNPSKRAVEELYLFMEACDLPITEDGHFLAYKKVRNDYLDIHSGTMDNSVGQKPSMPRNAVDDNRENTCSEGLHFCSKSYLRSFGGSDSRVMVLKIHPMNVVSIPKDYNNAKGRACEYEVVDELAAEEFIQPHYTSSYSDYTWEEEEEEEEEDNWEEEEEEEEEVEEDDDAWKHNSPSTQHNTPLPPPVGQHSLTDQSVRNIRKLLAEGWPLSSIAKVEGTSARTVARIRDGETYTEVK